MSLFSCCELLNPGTRCGCNDLIKLLVFSGADDGGNLLMLGDDLLGAVILRLDFRGFNEVTNGL